MDYRILGETLPVVEIRLMTGEPCTHSPAAWHG